MIKRMPLVFGVLLLGACATTQVTRPGTSSAQMQRDIAECEYEGQRASPLNAIIARQITIKCLKLKGYSL